MRVRKIELLGEIKDFEDAIPIGNGQLGALIYKSNPLRISVDRNDVWDLRTPAFRVKETFNLKYQMKLIAEGDIDTLRKDFNASGLAYPTKLPVNKLLMCFSDDKQIVKNSVNMTNGLAEFTYNDGTVVQSFISLSDPEIGYIKCNQPYEMKIDVLPYSTERDKFMLTKTLASLGYDRSEEYEKDSVKLSVQKMPEGGEYCVGCLTAKVGKEYVTVFGVDYSQNDESDLENFVKKLHKAIKVKFADEFARHKKEWRKYNAESYVALPACAKTIQRQWEIGNYLFRSTSRKGGLPIALQGVWTADTNTLPPWRGDFHFNTNVQMTYWAYMKANHPETGRNILDFLWEKRPVFRKYTKSYFDVDGIIVPGCMDAAGEVMGGWAPYSLHSTYGIWIAQAFDEYYRYTDDEEFLRERAFPYFKETEVAIRGLLDEKNGKNGNLHLPLSSSPEIYDDTIRSYLQPESNCDLALLRYLYTTLINYCKILGEDDSEYTYVLSRLDDFHTDEDGLEFSAVDKYQGYTNLAHTMAMYPIRLLDYDDPKDHEIMENTIRALEWYGTGSWVGHTFVWMVNHYAISRRGNGAAHYLETWCKVFTSKNGFHLNGDYKGYGATQFHYRPFTLEANFGFNDGVQEMLVKDRKGYVELFPAIPAEWSEDISFKLGVYGGMLVECKMKGGKIVKLTITAKKARKVTLKSVYLDEALVVDVKPGVNEIL